MLDINGILSAVRFLRYTKTLQRIDKLYSIYTYRKMSLGNLPKVLITRSDVPAEGIELLRSKCELEIWPKPSPIPQTDLLQRIKGKDALYCMLTERIDKEVLEVAGSNLKVIGTMSVGYDHIDLGECKRRGIQVGNTPGILTDATAELTIALLLATSRRLVEASKEVTNGGWARCSWGPLWMCGSTLTGSTVGIVGLGRIGFAVAERLKSFKVKKIVYSGNSPKPEASSINAEFIPFDELLKVSDFVVVCCALSDETKGLFEKTAFEKMKPTAIFVNTSRGAIVNHDDLYDALTTGKIRAAGLDVMTPEPLPVDHKLTKLMNCVLMPHIGSATVETRTAMAVLTANNVLAGLEGSSLPCPL